MEEDNCARMHSSSSVLEKTASCENELAEGRTPNTLESDDAPISQDSQKNGKFIDRATSPLKPMQSESEAMGEDNRARMDSSRLRQVEERLETLEEKIQGPPESLREKDGSKAMEITAQEIPDTKNDMMIQMVVKRGKPTGVESQKLGHKIAEKWKQLGRRLGVEDATLSQIDHAQTQLSEKGYAMLEFWRQSKGAAATYQALGDALKDEPVQRRDLAEEFCCIKGKEVVEAGRNQLSSAKVRQIDSDMTDGLEQRQENLPEKVESQSKSRRKKICKTATKTRAQEIPETTVKQLEDVNEPIENSMENVEVLEKELRKGRDQMDDPEKMQEEGTKSLEKSSDCNNNTVLNETASCENELAADRAPNGLESEDFPVSLDRQENMGLNDRATPPFSPMQSKSEGNTEVTKQGQPMEEINIIEQDRNACQGDNDDAKKEDEDCVLVKAADQAKREEREKASLPQKVTKGNQTCSRCHKLEKELGALKTEMEQIKLKPNKEKTLVAEKLNGKAKLREANGRLDPVQENGLEEVIQKEREEKKEIESRLVSEKNALEKELQEREKELMKFKHINAQLTKRINDHPKKIKEVEKQSKALVTENKDLLSRIKTGECDTSEVCNELDRLSTEQKKLLTENESYKKKNGRLEAANNKLQLKINTKECEKKQLREERDSIAKTNGEFLQRIEGLEKENNRLEVKITTKECEMEQLREKHDSIATANEKSLQKIKDLENKIKEIDKYKSAASRALLPRGEDFQSPGAIYTIGNDGLANVVATRSSEGPGKADDVLNRKLGKEVTCGTKEVKGSWWCVDLGENYLLFPTHYSLRHGKKEGDSILRYWKLQGSIDGNDWKDIGTQRRKGDFSQPFPYATDTWSIEGEVGAFRYFKIIQTDRHSSKKYGIYLSCMEFYGILLKL